MMCAMILSIIVFGFVGGITGVTFGTEQINIIAHNTLRIPGHFHATVVSGTAMAFMGLTYYVVPLIFRKKVAFWGMAKWQPYIFAGGMVVFSLAMTFAGTFGVPRRTWDISYSQAPFDLQFSPAVDLVIGVMAVGGLVAAIGGAMYIVITVWSVFLGEPMPEITAPVMKGIPQGLTSPPKPLPADADLGVGEGDRAAKGTLVLVFVFLAAFVVYYFVNWKLLSGIWRVG